MRSAQQTQTIMAPSASHAPGGVLGAGHHPGHTTVSPVSPIHTLAAPTATAATYTHNGSWDPLGGGVLRPERYNDYDEAHRPGGLLGEMMDTGDGGMRPALSRKASQNMREDLTDAERTEMTATTQQRSATPIEGAKLHLDELGVLRDTEAGNFTIREDGTPERRSEPDEEFNTMAQYDYRVAGEPYRTYTWRMSLCLLLLGYLTTGLGGITNHWRRKGCLIYKLTLLESSKPGCCSDTFLYPEVMGFLGPEAGRARSPPVDLINQTPTPTGLPHCTNVGSWRSGDAKTAHFIAITLVVIWLFLRSCAAYFFLWGKPESKKKLFPRCAFACGVCGICCVVSYLVAWNESGLESGPALWMAGCQAAIDMIAFLCTLSSSGAGGSDAHPQMRSKISEVMDAWHTMPRRVKFVYTYFIVSWALIIPAIPFPWITRETCTGIYCCEMNIRLFYVDEKCGLLSLVDRDYSLDKNSTNVIFQAPSATVMVSGLTGLLFYLPAFGLTAKACYLGWHTPTRWPKYGMAASLCMCMSVALFGAILSGVCLCRGTLSLEH